MFWSVRQKSLQLVQQRELNRGVQVGRPEPPDWAWSRTIGNSKVFQKLISRVRLPPLGLEGQRREMTVRTQMPEPLPTGSCVHGGGSQKRQGLYPGFAPFPPSGFHQSPPVQQAGSMGKALLCDAAGGGRARVPVRDAFPELRSPDEGVSALHPRKYIGQGQRHQDGAE